MTEQEQHNADETLRRGLLEAIEQSDADPVAIAGFLIAIAERFKAASVKD